VRDADPSMLVGMGFLAVCTLLFGIAPQFLIKTIIVPAVQAIGGSFQGSISWFGLHFGSGETVPVTLGALITITAVFIGWLVLNVVNQRETKGSPAFSGGESLPLENHVEVNDFSALAETSLTPLYQVMDPDPFYLCIWRGITQGAERIVQGASILERNMVWSVLIFAGVFAVVILAL